MPAASYLQTSFLGGEFSPLFQGRADDPRYRSGMNLCFNVIPVEEGAATRRPGTRWCGITKNGQAGALRAFDFTENVPYNMEFTQDHLRFWQGYNLVLDSQWAVVAISSADPAVVQTSAPHTWSTGDSVIFTQTVGTPTGAGTVLLYNRQFDITVIDATHFSIADAGTGDDFDGSTVTLGAVPLLVGRALDFTVPYQEADLDALRVVQDEQNAYIFHDGYAPQVLENLSGPDIGFATFGLDTVTFVDGPYLDAPNDGSTVTPGSLTGTVTCVFSSVASVNGGDGFQPGDVGRSIRLYSQPAAWAIGTTYTAGQVVWFNDIPWSALVNNTGKQPDLDDVSWAIDVTAAIWTYGAITTVNSTTSVDVALAAADPQGFNAGGPLLYTTPIVTYQVGAFSDYVGWPSVAAFGEGRFWFGSKIYPNRFDACMSNGDQIAGTPTPASINFGPTGIDGTVADNCGITETLRATQNNSIFWMLADSSAVIIGTQAGEWKIQASSQNDPITPTSIQAHRVTKFGCSNVEARQAPLSILFVERYATKLIEYVSDLYSGKQVGTNLAVAGKHLTSPGIAEVAYQQEVTPIVWARLVNGALIGCTYKRELAFGTSPPTFYGWHQHQLGWVNSDPTAQPFRQIEALQSGPSQGGAKDSVTLITNDPTASPQIRFVEILTDIFDVNEPATSEWFLDEAVPPVLGQVLMVGDVETVRLYGFFYMAGKTVTVWGGGVDLGDWPVQADGHIDIPLGGDPNGWLTTANLAALSGEAYPNNNVYVEELPGSSPDPQPTYLGIGEFIGAGSTLFLVDWKRGFCYTGADSDGELVRFSTSPGNAVGSVTSTSLYGPDFDFQTPYALLPSGDIIHAQDESNATGLRRINGPGFTLMGTFGSPNNGFANNASAIRNPGGLIGIECGDEFAIAFSAYTGDNSGNQVLTAVDMTTFEWTGYTFGMSENTASMLVGPNITVSLPNGHVSHQTALAYILGSTSNGFVPNYSNPLGTYILSADRSGGGATSLATTRTGQIVPTDVDPTWTNFNTAYAGYWDQTDNGVIAYITTSVPDNWSSSATYGVDQVIRYTDGHDYSSLVGSNTNNVPVKLWAVGTTYAATNLVTGSDHHIYSSVGSGNTGHNPVGDAGVHWTDEGAAPWLDLGAATYTQLSYLVKINMATGELVWKLALDVLMNDARGINQQSLIKLGRLAISGNDGLQYFINTTTGTLLSTQTITGLSTAGPQIYNDETAELIGGWDYVDTTGSPAPIAPTTTSFSNWGAFPGVPFTSGIYNLPMLAGFTYNSEGQLLRPIAPQEAGAQNGPALGKTRRNHQAAILFYNSYGVDLGSDFSKTLYPAKFASPGSTPYVAPQLWSGVYWTPVEDDYSFDGMLCWRSTRPYPCTVVSIEGFIKTQDR